MVKKFKKIERDLKMKIKEKLKYTILVSGIILASVSMGGSFSAHSAAQPVAFKLSPEESYIKFQATQGGSPIKGEFKVFFADINFHPEALAESKVKVIIDIGSFIVDDADAKSVLKDPEWFSASLFPQAIFEAKSFKSLGDKNYEAEGNLTIKGHTELTKLTFKLNEFTSKSASVSGEAIIKRKAFKIGEESTDSIKDDVHVYVSVNAVAN